MKTRFSTFDICSAVADIRENLLGMRVVNIYDIDNKTYLIKLAQPDKKSMILLESGNRFHMTAFEWPKNMMPSGFSMKLRKHLRTRRLESIQQLGTDRIVDFAFGSGEAAYHIILELYDRGNIVLTDHEYIVLNILRPRTDQSQDVKFAVREKYPIELAKSIGCPNEENLKEILKSCKEGEVIKKVLTYQLPYGPALIEHSLLSSGIKSNSKIGKEFNCESDLPLLCEAMKEAERVLQENKKGNNIGYIIQKTEKRPTTTPEGSAECLLTYDEFHPYLFKQHENSSYIKFDGFTLAVDEFFSKLSSQKLDVKALQQEKQALKKLENVKKDHEKRIQALQSEQELDDQKGHYIQLNLTIVDKAIQVINSALANQIDWDEIQELVNEAQAQDDPVASIIKGLKLDKNHMTILLSNPYEDEDDQEKPLKIDIDLALTAYANARKYYDMKKNATQKEQKTIDAANKALKSAERKTKQTLKEVQTIATINKSRKTYWFEKFLWFISSENYVVIGGRDQQQNELIVKRYLRPTDVYVHADLHGASSVIIKNPNGGPIPPKTLNEAGGMAICNSAAWDAKVVTSAWWVYANQVSKTAPTGEYLTTGSFMIRGKKNFLPPSYLIYGFGVLFKVEDGSIYRHKDERKVRVLDEDTLSVADSVETMSVADSIATESEVGAPSVSDSESDSDDDKTTDSQSTDINDDVKIECEEANEQLVKQEQDNTNVNIEDTSQNQASGDLSIQVTVEDDKAQADSSSEEEACFPDTSIALQHVKGDKYTLQRNTSTVSSEGNDEENENVFYLGDDQPVVFGEKSEGVSKKKLSAKQRKLMKKAKATGAQNENSDCKNSEDIKDIDEIEPKQTPKKKEKNKQNNQPQQQQPKRGQKAKLKKIKDKYGDQDEEERKLRMEILQAAGQPKEDKKKNKKSKQKEAQKLGGSRQQQQQKPGGPGQPQQKKIFPGRKTLEDIKEDVLSIAVDPNTPVVPVVDEKPGKDDGDISDEEKQAVLEEENIQLVSDASLLDSLTYVPHEEDELLFAVPVCAPYNTLNNCKFRVKLTPGSQKRGKACKTALGMFMNDRSATQREKDLLKSLKDADVSRNMPGKVKVSAPNLQTLKQKR